MREAYVFLYREGQPEAALPGHGTPARSNPAGEPPGPMVNGFPLSEQEEP